jgi:hypothetical protein
MTTGRPKILTDAQESELKQWMLLFIMNKHCTCAKDFIKVLPELPLKEWNYRIYMNKFNLSYKAPYASEEDIVKHEQWYDKQEANGVWLGPKTTIEALVEREADPQLNTHPNFKSLQYVIDAANEETSIETLGDYQELEKA